MADLNNLWCKHLHTIVQNHLKNVNNNNALQENENTLYEKNDLLKTTISKLDYQDSQIYYPESFIQELEKILNNFNEKNHYEKNLAQNQLIDLVKDESAWRGLAKKMTHEVDMLKSMFPKQLGHFKSQSKEEYFNPSEEEVKKTQRAYTMYFDFRFKLFIKGFIDNLVLQNKLHNIKGLSSVLTNRDFEIIKRDFIFPDWIFCDLVRVIVKKAYDNLYNKSTRENEQKYNEIFKEDSLVVSKVSVFYEFRRVLAMYFITATLTYAQERKIHPIEDLDSILNSIRNYLWQKQFKYDTDKQDWWVLHQSQITNAFLFILETSDFFVEITNDLTKNKRQKVESPNPYDKVKYILPSTLDNMVHMFTELPRVSVPRNITDDQIDICLRPSLFGENKVSKNKELKDFLNLAQRKRFSVNKTYVTLLKSLINIDVTSTMSDVLVPFVSSFDIPFPLITEINDAREDLNSYQFLIHKDPIQTYLFDEMYTYLIGENIKNIYVGDLRDIVGSSHLENDIEELVKQKKLHLNNLVQSKKKANSIVKIAELFSDKVLFITNNFCIRLRIYPRQPLISRTSGDYKQILFDATPTRITIEGFIELLKCYYTAAASEVHKKNFDIFLKGTKLSKKTGVKNLVEFFKQNPVDFTNSGVFLYLSVLHMELLKVIETKKTAVNVEIDQVASVGQLLAFFFRNRKLALASNLLGGEFVCPYTYIRKTFKDYYDQFLADVEFSEKAHNMLLTDRKIHKYAFMCFGYGQTNKGRVEDFINRFYELHPQKIDLQAEEYLRCFSANYLNIFNKVFPGITSQIEILKEVVKIVVKETGEMTLYNINGDKMTWSRFKHKKMKRKGFNPITKQQHSFSVGTVETDLKNQKPKNDISEHTGIIISYIIHSIDASIIHRIITNVKKETSYIINSLHDCGLMHPNIVKSFYDELEKLFTSRELYNTAETCFFSAARNQVSPSTIPKINALQAKFEEHCDDFHSELVNIDIRNCFRGES